MNVFLVWNEYTDNVGSGGMDLLRIFQDEEKAVDWLDKHVTGLRGRWTDNHSVFNATATYGMDLDQFYIEKREVG
jgi:hypothetical protein